MIVTASDLESFLHCIVYLTRENIGFKADALTLTIKLTGAF